MSLAFESKKMVAFKVSFLDIKKKQTIQDEVGSNLDHLYIVFGF
jgi:hypothetical protein